MRDSELVHLEEIVQEPAVPVDDGIAAHGDVPISCGGHRA